MEYTISGYPLTVLAFAAIVAGLALLIRGGDWTVDAAAYIARNAGLSQLFIGATIVAFGTSVPELFTSVNANLSGFPGLSVGNIVGSNIANILLIIGATAIVFAILGNPKHLLKDAVIVLIATALLMALMSSGLITRWQGAIMTAILLVYIVYQYRVDAGADDGDEDEEEPGIASTPKAVLLLLGGLAMLAVGSEMLVQGAVAAGTALGVPEAVIGLTVVAFGTSLPELSTCFAAAVKRHTNMIIGNILGSNLFNILWIIGITSVIKPITVGPELVEFDMWFMGGVTVLFIVWMLTVSRIGRVLGAAMVLAYLAFIGWSYQGVIFGGEVAMAG